MKFTLFAGFCWALFICLHFQASDSAVCSSLSQTECSSASGCYWTDSHCSCASNVTMDVVFALDASGSIGASSFQTALTWMEDVVESGITQGARVGIIKFSTRASTLMTLQESEGKTTDELVTFISNIYYDAGYTNTVEALDYSINLYRDQGNPYAQWVLILITDGDPCCLPYVDSTDVCSRASTLKAMGITVVIIGVGSGWNPAKVDCLVTDDSYIIPVDRYSQNSFKTQVLPKLSTITCPVTYNLIITEAQIDTVDGSTGSRFVEVFNPSTTVRLSDLSISGVFTGSITADTTKMLDQNSYMVFYDSDAPDLPSCQDCSCMTDSNKFCTDATYIQCCNSGCPCKFAGGKRSNTNWTFSLTDTTTQDEIDKVTYDASTWPRILKGYTYELKYLGYDNQKGDNWQQSCNAFGTPGSHPILNCSWTCTAEQCQVSGASGATCSGNTCDCNSNLYYFAERTCKKVPPPGICYAYWLKDANTSARSWQFVWEAAKTDRDLKYQLTYFSKTGQDVITTQSRVKDVSDYDYSRGVYQKAGQVNTSIGSSVSTGVDCWPKTMSPTAAPTFHPPVVFIAGDICAEVRCSCAEKDLYNCTGETIEKDYVADDNKTQYVTIRKWPEAYSGYLKVFWQVRYHDVYEKPSDETKLNANLERKDQDIVEAQRRFFEAKGFKGFTALGHVRNGRKLVSTFTSTTSPEVNMTSTNAPTDEFVPSSGIINFIPSSFESKISFIIKKAFALPGETKYRLFILTLETCNNTSPQDCVPVYPSTLYMVVDITGGSAISTSKTQKETPTWLWYLIGGLVLFAAALAFLGYRYWWKNKQTNEELKETNAELDAAHEENEMGFGRDLAQGDIQFNPIATGVPNTTIAPQLNTDLTRAGLMANDAKADVAIEKFKHREEFGQKMPDKRGRPPPPGVSYA